MLLFRVFKLSPKVPTFQLHFQNKFSEIVKLDINHFILFDKIQSVKAKANMFCLTSEYENGRAVLSIKSNPKALSVKPQYLKRQIASAFIAHLSVNQPKFLSQPLPGILASQSIKRSARHNWLYS